jgi:hypothetical protein
VGNIDYYQYMIQQIATGSNKGDRPNEWWNVNRHLDLATWNIVNDLGTENSIGHAGRWNATSDFCSLTHLIVFTMQACTQLTHSDMLS